MTVQNDWDVVGLQHERSDGWRSVKYKYNNAASEVMVGTLVDGTSSFPVHVFHLRNGQIIRARPKK